MAKLTIDGQEIEVPDGTRLFEACTQARGEPLPHFCYHPDLSIAGVCRLCQVEIEGMPKLTIACNTVVKDGMVVKTRSPKVQQAVRQILEMHLINHPVDCPICDQAGECGLQDQYMDYGLYTSEVAMADKVLKSKAKVIGPHVILDQERCVLCSRCVRFCEEVTGTGELGIFNRGDRAEIDVAPGRELDNNYSLNTVDICPVGALTSRDFRFQKRVWLLRSTPSVCPGCATGCNIRVDHQADRVYRLKPRRNDAVNGRWMCDIGRMVYKDLHDEKRLAQPLVRVDKELQETTWQSIWPRLCELLAPGQVDLALVGPGQSLEELVLWRHLMRKLGCQTLCGGISGAGKSQGDSVLLAADRTPNRTALTWLDLPAIEAADLAGRVRKAERTVLVYGQDPAAGAEDLQEAWHGCAHLVYFGSHLNATARVAELVIPLSMWAEKAGITVNRAGRLQEFRRAISPPGQAKEDWRLLGDLQSELTAEQGPTGLPALRRFVQQELALPAEQELNNLPADGWAPESMAERKVGGR